MQIFHYVVTLLKKEISTVGDIKKGLIYMNQTKLRLCYELMTDFYIFHPKANNVLSHLYIKQSIWGYFHNVVKYLIFMLSLLYLIHIKYKYLYIDKYYFSTYVCLYVTMLC